METKREYGFFSEDFKESLMKLLAGLLPMATLVPIIINRSHNIFNINYCWSYALFIFLYYGIPVIAMVRFLGHKLRKRRIEKPNENLSDLYVQESYLPRYWVLRVSRFMPAVMLVCSLAIFYIFESHLRIVFITLCITTFLGILFFYRLIALDYWRIRYHLSQFIFFGDKDLEVLSKERIYNGVLQCGILSALCLIVLALFLGNYKYSDFPKSVVYTHREQGDSLNIFKYLDALAIEEDSAKTYSDTLVRIREDIKFILFKGELGPGSGYAKNDSLYAKTAVETDSILYKWGVLLYQRYQGMPEERFRLYTKDDILLKNSYAGNKDSFMAYERKLDTDLNKAFPDTSYERGRMAVQRVRGYEDRTSYYIGKLIPIVNNFKKSLEEGTKEKWSIVLRRIQLYTLMLYGVILLWLTGLLFYFNLHDIYSGAVLRVMNEKEDESEGSITRHLKTLIIVTILLMLPFLRNFDAEHLDLKHPFLHFSLEHLFSDEKVERYPVQPICYGPFTYIDSSKSYSDSIDYGKIDSMIKNSANTVIESHSH